MIAAALFLALAAAPAKAVTPPFEPRGFKEAKALAREQDRLLVAFVRTRNCADCDILTFATFPDPAVRAWLDGKAVAAEFDAIGDEAAIAELKVDSTPLIVVLDSRGKELRRIYGAIGPKEFLDAMRPKKPAKPGKKKP